MSATEIVEQFRRLPPTEQRAVFEQIRDEYDAALTLEQIEEFERRGEELRRDPASGVPWEKVRAELKDRIKGR